MSIFKFKQFDVDQSGCAMKINTDGVLLAALTDAVNPSTILDIGTGTGVLALMMAQKFSGAKVEAVEIDEKASVTAGKNFQSSNFSERLSVVHSSIENHRTARKYDLIISNPPFFVNDLKSTERAKGIARHADAEFFVNLIQKIGQILTAEGKFWVILPVKQALSLIAAGENMGLSVSKKIEIHSDQSKPPFRLVVAFGREKLPAQTEHFNIYQREKVYTQQYKDLLRDFFLGY